MITPVLNEKIEDGKSMIYCATLQVAWDMLKNEILGEKEVQLRHNSDLLRQLNHIGFPLENLDLQSYTAIAGWGQETLDKFKNLVLTKFSAASLDFCLSLLPKQLSPEEGMVTAYLEKIIKFVNAFREMDEPINFNGSKVAGWEIDDSTINNQVSVIDEAEYRGVGGSSGYNSTIFGQNSNLVYKSGLFALKIDCGEDELIMVLTDKDYSLDIILAGFIWNWGTDLDSHWKPINHNVHIPVIDLDEGREFEELTGVIVNAKPEKTGFKFVKIMQVSQRTKFHLDQTGVELRSMGYIGISGYSGYDTTKTVVFDRPFLLYMKRKNYIPYFVAWIDKDVLVEK